MATIDNRIMPAGVGRRPGWQCRRAASLTHLVDGGAHRHLDHPGRRGVGGGRGARLVTRHRRRRRPRNATKRPLTARRQPTRVTSSVPRSTTWITNSPTATTPVMAATMPMSRSKPGPPRCTAVAWDSLGPQPVDGRVRRLGRSRGRCVERHRRPPTWPHPAGWTRSPSGVGEGQRQPLALLPIVDQHGPVTGVPVGRADVNGHRERARTGSAAGDVQQPEDILDREALVDRLPTVGGDLRKLGSGWTSRSETLHRTPRGCRLAR